LIRYKILFLIGNYGTGGKERQLTELIRNLPKSNYEVHLFLKNDQSFFFGDIKHSLSSFYSLNKKNFSPFDFINLRGYIDSVSPNLLFSFSTVLSHYVSLLKLFGLIQTRLINSSIRDAPIKFNFFNRFDRLLYKFYNEVVSNSHAGLLAYNQLNSKGRHVLHNGYDMNRRFVFSSSKLLPSPSINDDFKVVMVARMDCDEKDQQTFILAANKIIKKINYMRFYLIGDGHNRDYYESLVDSFRIKSHVTFLGEVDKIEPFIKSANVSVLTSGSRHGEGIPNVVLESLACGIPVIATDNGGTREILFHNSNGFLIKNGDYIDLANKIIYLYNNPNVLKNFSKKGIETVKNHFSIEKMIFEFESIITSGSSIKSMNEEINYVD